jgi:hypothetical protein
MAASTLTWPAALRIICAELVEYAAHRDAGRSMTETAEAMGIGPTTADHYEDTITRLLAAVTTSAAPGEGPPRAADTE